MSFTLNRDSTGVPVAGYDSTNDLIKVSLSGSSAIFNGTYTVTGTGSQIDSTGQACTMVTVQNSKDSNGYVLVGNSSAQTIELAPGASRDYYVANVNQIYAKFASGTTSASLNWEAKS